MPIPQNAHPTSAPEASTSFTPPGASRTPRASIIIPAGRAALRDDLVQFLRRECAAKHDLEVIWVTPFDRPGVDGVPGFRIEVTGKLLPPGAMRNRGAQVALAEMLLFLDDDCVPPPEWVERMKASLVGTPEVGAVGCAYPSASRMIAARLADHALFGDCISCRPAFRPVASGALAVRREAFRAAGGFDEYLLASEDLDFSLRLQSAGWRVKYDPTIRVAHHHDRTTLRSVVRCAYLGGFRSGLTAQRRHQGLISWLARLSLRLSHPALYFWLVLPYATLVAAGHVAGEFRAQPASLLLSPACFVGRLVFQWGVWRRLCDERRGSVSR